MRLSLRTHILLAGLLWSALLLAAPLSASAGQIFGAPTYMGLNSGLAGHWTFDGKDTFSNNVTLNRGATTSANGTLTATGAGRRPEGSLGKIGQGLDFDGVASNVTLGTNFKNMTPFTVSVWAYPRTQGQADDGVFLGGADDICGQNNSGEGWGFGFYGEFGQRGELCFEVDYATGNLRAISSQNTATFNEWQHFLMTWDGSATAAGGVRIYRNGVEVGYATQVNGGGARVSEDPTPDLFIGTTSNNITYDGILDEVRIYDRILTLDEIKRLYKIGATAKIGAPNSSGSLASGLVGWWTMDGNDMSHNSSAILSASDRSGNGIKGTAVSAARSPRKAIGKIGQALDFNGSDTDLDLGITALLDLDSRHSISAWVYTRAINVNQTIFSSGGDGCCGTEIDFLLDYNGGAGEYRFRLWYTGAPADTLRSNAAVIPNRWYHVAGTWDGSIRKLYLNGALDNSDSFSAPISEFNNTAGIGFNTGNGQEFDGYIDDLRVYNRALSADEIKRLYKMGSTAKTGVASSNGSLSSGLVGWWTMDGADISIDGSSVITAFDRSGNSRHASSSPQTPPTRAIGKIGQGLEFDSSTNLLSAGKPTVFNNMTEKTICAWIKPTSFATRDIMGKWDTGEFGGWTLRLGDSCATGQDLCYYHNFSPTNGRWSPSGGITLNAWNHACMSYTTSELNDPVFYINGTSRAVTEVVEPGGTSRDESTASLVVGNISEGAADLSFGGTIDDLRLYNRILTADEIKRLYNMGR